MESFIVRIYRRGKGSHEKLLGTVERPGEDVKLAFTSFDELRNILGPLAVKDVFAEAWDRQKGKKPNQGDN